MNQNEYRTEFNRLREKLIGQARSILDSVGFVIRPL